MRTLIVSDLHLGNGGAYDVFAGGEELPSFLDRLAAAPTRVIVNGDGVDFLMNEDPLVIDPERAVQQARAIVAAPASRAVIEAFGRVLARGGEVIVRLGNHDVELSLPGVQAIVREALAQPPEVAGRLAFQLGDAPALLSVGGARILVTHGEHGDPWNQVDYRRLAEVKGYEYAAGSVLVKRIMNPATREHGLRFTSLLKPDFQGAALTALAVVPAAMKLVFQKASLDIAWQLFRKGGMAASFTQDEADLGLAGRVAEAGLTAAEQAAIEELLGDGPASFAGDDGAIGRAGIKLGRAGLRLYAGLQRRLAGSLGDAYFSLEPEEAEWKDARRLAEKYQAGAVVIGHTHAARWKEDAGVVFANTGTWIWLMQLPRYDAGDDAWGDFLAELRDNPGLVPARQKLARTVRRFTAVLAEPHADGGAAMSLVEWDGGALLTLGETRVPRASTAQTEDPGGRRVHFNGFDAVRRARAADPVVRPLPAQEERFFFRPPFGVEEDDVTKAGWGVVFAADTPDDVRAALQPLIDHRAKTVRPDRIKVLDYQAGEDARAWLARHGVSTSNVAPTKVPYYLLLAGPPTSIPFELQHLLAVEYLVGRVAFPAADGYARYAASVVAYESDPGVSGRREVAFWGTAHDDETRLGKDGLLEPLAEGWAGGDGPIADAVGFRRRRFVATDATKANLVSLLRDGPAVLFTASHGLQFPEGHALQLRAQGALLCQEIASAPAAGAGAGDLDPAFYFAADDVPDDARLHGLVAVAFACFSAGTPAEGSDGTNLADAPFVASLPQRLLAHPNGGALAVVGHVDSALAYSFQPDDAAALGPQIQAFRDTLGHVMAGRTVGYAAHGFGERAAALASGLLPDIDPQRRRPQPAAPSTDDDADRQERRMGVRRMEHDDAQRFVILGDPAVRLRIDRLT